jgi:hypothetical protein
MFSSTSVKHLSHPKHAYNLLAGGQRVVWQADRQTRTQASRKADWRSVGWQADRQAGRQYGKLSSMLTGG